MDPPGFSCPGVPLLPIISVFFNMVLFAQVCAALFWFHSQISILKKIPLWCCLANKYLPPNSHDWWQWEFVWQLHEEAWYRFVILSLIALGVYAGYGQYNAVPSSSEHSTIGYHGIPSEAPWADELCMASLQVLWKYCTIPSSPKLGPVFPLELLQCAYSVVTPSTPM